MKVYIAASFDQRNTEEMKTAVNRLTKAGYLVTANWLNIVDVPMEKSSDVQYAIQDIRDIDGADYILVFLGPDPTPGKHFELGYAFGLHFSGTARKRFVLVGEPYHIFHTLFPVVKTLSDAIEMMNMLRGT